MLMGQVWSKADFDGLNVTGFQGGHGSVLAVTAQNPGPDRQWGTDDDRLAPLNVAPVQISIDATPDANCRDMEDRVRGFYSFHAGGANFVFADGSVHFVSAAVAARVYRALSTIDGGEPISADAF